MKEGSFFLHPFGGVIAGKDMLSSQERDFYTAMYTQGANFESFLVSLRYVEIAILLLLGPALLFLVCFFEANLVGSVSKEASGSREKELYKGFQKKPITITREKRQTGFS